MSGSLFYPADADSFAQIVDDVESVLDTDRRLPDWPFRVAHANVDICQFSLAIEGPFGPVLQALVDTHEDDDVSLVTLDPTPDYYRQNYGSYPAFRRPGMSIGQTYWESVAHEPDGDPTGSVTYTANVVGITGSSREWAVWAERSWDIAILLSQRAGGPWLSAGVDFVPAEVALADFTEPHYKSPLATHDRVSFLNNVRMRGTLS